MLTDGCTPRDEDGVVDTQDGTLSEAKQALSQRRADGEVKKRAWSRVYLLKKGHSFLFC